MICPVVAMKTNPTVTPWHPVTKALVGVVIVVVPYLAWTSLGEAPAAVAATAQRVTAPEAANVVAQANSLEARVLRQLPPLEQFTTMVDRPLFSPTRRSPDRATNLIAISDMPKEMADQASAASAPAVRFVGTIGQDGGMTALILHDESPAVSRLVVGDEVEGWRVIEVMACELVLEQEAERLVLTILQ